MYIFTWYFPGGSAVKKPQETWVQFLGEDDDLEKATATHSSILAQGIPWTEEPGGLQSMRPEESRHNLVTTRPPRWVS